MCICACGQQLICKCPKCGKIHGQIENEIDRISRIEMQMSDLVKKGYAPIEAGEIVLKGEKNA